MLNGDRSVTHRLANSRNTRPFKQPFKRSKQFYTSKQLHRISIFTRRINSVNGRVAVVGMYEHVPYLTSTLLLKEDGKLTLLQNAMEATGLGQCS